MSEGQEFAACIAIGWAVGIAIIVAINYWPRLKSKPRKEKEKTLAGLRTVKQLVQQGRKLSELSGDELCELYQDREITAEIFNVIEREVTNRMVTGENE